MMNENERKEYAAELVRLAVENPEGINPQLLVDMISARTDVPEVDDRIAILNYAAEALQNEFAKEVPTVEEVRAEASDVEAPTDELTSEGQI